MADAKKKEAPPKSKGYKIEGDKIVIVKKICPRCGAGCFMANHKDRWHCGRCRYTIFKDAKQEAPKK